jgi:hypothetical protein
MPSVPSEPSKSRDPVHEDGKMREDEDAVVPRASDDVVLDETARLAREGRRELESGGRDPDAAKS